MSTLTISQQLTKDLGRTPTTAEIAAARKGYCCLYYALVQTKGISSVKLGLYLGLASGTVRELRRKVASHKLKCTGATRCISPGSRE